MCEPGYIPSTKKVINVLKVNLGNVAATGKGATLTLESEMKEKYSKTRKYVFHYTYCPYFTSTALQRFHTFIPITLMMLI